MKSEKAHTRYKNQAGEVVPGVTTILGVIAKPALLHWAWECGMNGVDYRKARDKAGDIGTLTHYRVMCEITGEEPDLSSYSPQEIDASDNAMLSWYSWLEETQLEVVYSEKSLISEQYQYGGTIDLYGMVNGRLELVDFKTGKAIYPDMIAQVAAYHQLLVEEGSPVEGVRILRFGRDESEGFEEKRLEISALEPYYQIFLACLQIYNTKKSIGWR